MYTYIFIYLENRGNDKMQRFRRQYRLLEAVHVLHRYEATSIGVSHEIVHH